jgi:uncharacterized damage-inducible protein DinB
MTHALHDPIRHNAWANTQLLAFCQNLDEQTLTSEVPGTYGSIIATLRHIIYCEIEFLELLLGSKASDSWAVSPATGLARLVAHTAHLASAWETFLASDVDGERLLSPGEGARPVPAGIVIAVVLYHGSEHRGQVCTALSVLGHTPPDLTPWAYAFATGRMQAP